MQDGRKLAMKRTGVKLLSLPASGPDANQEIMIAAWQGLEHGVPHRCVVRCDGNIQDNTFGAAKVPGFPVGVLKVDYIIGGMSASVLVDAVKQSALTVWAESIQVSAIWDRAKIQALTDFYNEIEASEDLSFCRKQLLATAISVGQGDTGAADARYQQVLQQGTTVLAIPQCARAMRILNATNADDSIALASAVVTKIAWGNDKTGVGPYVHRDEAPDGTCAYDVPSNSSYLTIVTSTNATIASPHFIEWILAPAAL